MTIRMYLWLSIFFLCACCGGGEMSKPCVNLQRVKDGIVMKEGHSRECFASRVLSFESCRQLLFYSKTCTALSYSEKKCSLHDDTRENFKKYLSYPSHLAPLLYTKESLIPSDLSSQSLCATKSFEPALQKFRKCVFLDNNVSTISKNEIATLPLLGIIISVTSHWVHTHKAAMASITSNFECYAAAHDYVFVFNVMDDMPLEQFFHERHNSVLTQHLHRFQYLLHLDADSLVLNISRPLDRFMKPDGPHVQLHMNENGEVTAATYLIKNSHYSRCFLKYWADFSPPRLSNVFRGERGSQPSPSDYDERLYEVPNYDNGDLVSAITNMLGPEFYRTCLEVIVTLPLQISEKLKNSYHQTMVECWKILQPTLQFRVKKWTKGMLRIYLPREGFWRTHSRRNRFGTDPRHWWNELTASCYPSSDIIGHGWKGMMKNMWPMVSDDMGNYDIRHPNSTKLCSNALRNSSSGGNLKCEWLDPVEEFKVAQRYCLWKSPACIKKKDQSCDHHELGNSSFGMYEYNEYVS